MKQKRGGMHISNPLLYVWCRSHCSHSLNLLGMPMHRSSCRLIVSPVDTPSYIHSMWASSTSWWGSGINIAIILLSYEEEPVVQGACCSSYMHSGFCALMKSIYMYIHKLRYHTFADGRFSYWPVCSEDSQCPGDTKWDNLIFIFGPWGVIDFWPP